MFRPRFDLYIRFYPGRVVVSDPASGAEHEITGSGFDHPRMPVGDFGAASAALNDAIRRIAPSKLHRPRRVLLHVPHEWEGGLNEVDARVIKDLSMSAAGIGITPKLFTRPDPLAPTEVQRLLKAKVKNEPTLR